MAQQQTLRGKKPEAVASGVRREPAATVPDRQQAMVYESFNPTFHWSRQPGSHVLRLDLPGFKKEDLKVQVDSSGKLSAHGRRQVAESNYCRFDQVFDVPKGCNIDLITGKLEDGRLIITMPEFDAKPKEQQVQPQAPQPQLGHVTEEKGVVDGSTQMAPNKEVSQLDGEMQKNAKTADDNAQRQQREEPEDALWRAGLASGAESLLEKIYENKKVIAVAVVVFSVGFYLSRKLKS